MKLSQKAFTILEIAVTFSIIMIITLTGIAGYLRVRDLAVRNICINNLKQIETAAEQWYMNNRASLPSSPTIKSVDKWILSNDGSIIPNPGYSRPAYAVPWSGLVPEYLSFIPECSGKQYDPPMLNQRPICPHPELRLKHGHHL